MRKLFYIGLESYESRYTLQLQEWNERVFKRRGINYEIVTGSELDDSKAIVTGSVLDAHGRSYYSLSQTMNLVEKMKRGEVRTDDVIFYEDMFTPGLECLPYIIQQSPKQYRPRVYVRCLAQSVDPDDFIVREGMLPWMRRYEQMIDEFVSGILVASEELVAHLRIAGFRAPIYVTGLPFGKSEVQQRVSDLKPLNQRAHRVCFAARWDDEKQPDFFMDLAERFATIDPDLEFALLTGHNGIKSNNPDSINRAAELQKNHSVNFSVYDNLKKNDYYNILKDSKILFNCALQDWVSNTVSEADTLGCLTAFPAYRSFPEVFANNHNHMYVPWSLDSAQQLLEFQLDRIQDLDLDHFSIGKISDYQDGTISRTLDVFRSNQQSVENTDQITRNTWDFRKHVSKAKYE